MIEPTMRATTLLLWGIIIHWFCDWLLQNSWQATNKANLRHPAAYVHSSIHLVGLLLLFPWYVAILIAITHLFIDTRVPLMWWRGFFRQTREGEVALHVALWGDQTLHIVILAIAALIVGGL